MSSCWSGHSGDSPSLCDLQAGRKDGQGREGGSTRRVFAFFCFCGLAETGASAWNAPFPSHSSASAQSSKPESSSSSSGSYSTWNAPAHHKGSVPVRHMFCRRLLSPAQPQAPRVGLSPSRQGCHPPTPYHLAWLETQILRLYLRPVILETLEVGLAI